MLQRIDWNIIIVFAIIHIFWIVGFSRSSGKVGVCIPLGFSCLGAILSYIFCKYIEWPLSFSLQIAFLSIYFLVIFLLSLIGVGGTVGIFLLFIGLPTFLVTKLFFHSTWIVSVHNGFAAVSIILSFISMIRGDNSDIYPSGGSGHHFPDFYSGSPKMTSTSSPITGR